jgi:hypothetical protein
VKDFLVTWEIDITAEDEHEAAHKALLIQRDPSTEATHFIVLDENGDSEEINLFDCRAGCVGGS